MQQSSIQKTSVSIRKALKENNVDVIKQSLNDIVQLTKNSRIGNRDIDIHFMNRIEVNKTFGFCQMDWDAIIQLVELFKQKCYRKFLSIGCGYGYTEALIGVISKHVGYPIDIVCTDPQLDYFSKKSYDEKKFVNDVHVLTHEEALNKYSDVDAVFLLWPGYGAKWSDEAVCMARQLGIKTIVYSGESKYGCTGTDEMHDELNENWHQSVEIDYPIWSGIHDACIVYDVKK